MLKFRYSLNFVDTSYPNPKLHFSKRLSAVVPVCFMVPGRLDVSVFLSTEFKSALFTLYRYTAQVCLPGCIHTHTALGFRLGHHYIVNFSRIEILSVMTSQWLFHRKFENHDGNFRIPEDSVLQGP